MEDEIGITRSIIDELHPWDMKWKVKVVFVEVSLMNFIVRYIHRDKMEGESGVFRSINDELHSSDIQRDQM